MKSHIQLALVTLMLAFKKVPPSSPFAFTYSLHLHGERRAKASEKVCMVHTGDKGLDSE